MDGREDGVNCAGREHESAAEASRGDTPLRWQDWIIGGDVSKD